MKIEKQPLEDHQVKLNVEITDDQLAEAERRAAVKLAKRVKIPGFRPGKAPYPVVLRTVGEAAVFEEALELLIDELYPKVIEEADIKPYGPGRLDNIPSKEPLVLEFVVPLEAEVILGDYKAMRKPYSPDPVTDEMVADAIENMRERYAIVEPVERSAEMGDVLSIMLSGTVFHEDHEDAIINPGSYQIDIRADDANEWPYPGFSNGLIGKNVGDEGDTEYTFPADFRVENMQGQQSRFHYKVESIKSRLLPELDDNFATTLGDFANMDELTQSIREMLEKQVEENYNEVYDAELIDELVEKSEFKFPKQMLEDEIHQSLHELEDRLGRQNLDMNIYLKSRNIDEAALQEEMKPVAEKRLKRSLVLYELGRLENIKIKPDELENRANNTLSYLNNVLPEKDARRLINKTVRRNVVTNVLADLMNSKTIDRLRDYARGILDEPQETQEKAVSGMENDQVATNEVEEPKTNQDAMSGSE